MLSILSQSRLKPDHRTDASAVAFSGEKDRLLVLDLIRSLAAIVVFLSHLRVGVTPLDVPMAGLAVDLFFLLSGYIIANRYDGTIDHTMSRSEFILRRVVRFYPMYAIGMMICLFTWYFLYPFSFRRIAIFQVFMLPYPTSDALYPMNGPAWSLLYEILVNIAYAIVLFRTRAAALAVLAVVSWTGLVVLGFRGYTPDGGWNHADMAVAVCRVCASFSLGILISRFQIGTVFRVRWGTGLFFSFLVVMPCILPVESSQYWFRFACIIMVFPIMIGLAAQVRISGPAPPLIAKLAGLSFPLYAIHWPLIELARMVSGKPPADFGIIFLSAFFIAVVTASAWVNSRIDEPLQRFAKNRIGVLFRRKETSHPVQ